MRASLERRLNEIWYATDRSPPAALRWLEAIYRRGVERDRRRGIARQPEALQEAPIVAIGNLTAGGGGKTPLTLLLCELAHQAGISVGVASRGYGRAHSDPAWADAAASAARGGDEPLLIAQTCGVPVRVDADRVAAATALLDRGVDVVIADDALQHWRLPHQWSLAVVDGRRGFGNGRLLPAGPLREPVSRLEHIDEVVHKHTRCSGIRVDAVMRLVPGEMQALHGGAHEAPGPGQAVDAVCAVADPGSFFTTLERLGYSVRRHPFPDHHAFSARDFAGLEGPLVMTAKDGVKCRGLGLEDAWVLPVSATVDDEVASRWVQTLRRLAQGQAT